MCKTFLTLVSLALLASSAAADIYQWQWVDPSDHSQGKSQSSTLCPGGAGANAVPGSVLTGRDLTQAYLSSFDLSYSSWFSDTLTDAYFAKANLYQMLIYQCSAQGADFTHVDAHTTNFRFTDLTGADFTDANLQTGFLDYCTLDNANFTRANLSNGSMLFASFYNANFTDANITGVHFNSAAKNGFTEAQLRSTASYKNHNLTGIRFSGGDDLSGWDFSGGIDLSQAHFEGAKLIGARFDGATLTSTNFLSANLTSADFSGASMIGSGFEAAEVTGANFSGADLTNADARSVRWTNANLSGAHLVGARFSFAADLQASQVYATASYQAHDLHGINLSFNTMHRWSFHSVDLSNANLAFSDLRGADFGGANLTQSDLTQSILHDADFSGGHLAGTFLDSADLRGATDALLTVASVRGAILPDGSVEGWSGTSYLGGMLRVANYHGSPAIPVHINGDVTRPDRAFFIFDDQPWQSTIRFDPGAAVDITNTRLVAEFSSDINPTSLVGHMFQIFDWSGVEPVGEFNLSSLNSQYTWDTTQLYSQGVIQLIGVPEPSSAMLCFVVVSAASVLGRRCTSGLVH